jgi:two-component system cell cycle response regulator DivK
MLLTGKRIFYIEDDTKNRVIVQTILEYADGTLGCHAWGAGNLIEQMLAFAPIDVVLLDLNLPNDLSGYDVYDTIRTYEVFAHVPIIAVSALDPAIEIPKARAKGFAGFIGKPIHLVHFPQQVASVIAGSRVWV